MNNLPTVQPESLTTKINSALPLLSTFRRAIFSGDYTEIIGYEFNFPEGFEAQYHELFQPVGIDMAKRLTLALSIMKKIDGNERRIAIVISEIAKEIQDQPLYAILTAFRDIKLEPGSWMPDVGTVVSAVHRCTRRRQRKAEKPREPDFVRDSAKVRRRVVRWASISRIEASCRTRWEEKFLELYQNSRK